MSMRLWKGKYSLSPVSCIPGNQENIQHPVLSHFDWALPSLNQTIQHGCKFIMWNKQFSTWPKVKATHGIQGCGSVYFFHKKNQSWNFILANKRMLQHFLMHGFNIGLHLWIIKYNWVQWFFFIKCCLPVYASSGGMFISVGPAVECPLSWLNADVFASGFVLMCPRIIAPYFKPVPDACHKP